MAFTTSNTRKYLRAAGTIVYTLFLKLPFLTIYYIPKSTRPHPEWTLFQSVMNSAMNSFLFLASIVQVVTPLDLSPGSFGDRVESMPAAPAALLVGPTRCDPSIEPAPTGGIWFPSRLAESSSDEEPIVLYFHGGGYAMGDVRTEGGFPAKMVTKHMARHAFFSVYRLGSNPGGRFPAALQDAIAAYHHLVGARGISPSRIVLAGDSAGGHLVVSLLRYLARYCGGGGESEGGVEGVRVPLGLPRAALLFSPCVDMRPAALEPARLRETIGKNMDIDYLDVNFMAWGARGFASDASGAEPYVCALGSPFRLPCPLWVSVGGLELFHRGVKRFVDEMRGVRGSKNNREIAFHVDEVANHDIIGAGNLTGWSAEAEKTAEAAGRWLRERGTRG